MRVYPKQHCWLDGFDPKNDFISWFEGKAIVDDIIGLASVSD